MKLSLPAYLLAASAAASERDVFHARNTANNGLRRRVQHAAEVDRSLEELDLSMSMAASKQEFGKVEAFGPEGVCKDEYKTLDLSEAYQPLRKPKQIHPDKDGVTRVTMHYEPVHYKGASFNNILRGWDGELPGPTLHLEPGGRMELELINCNRQPEGPYGGLFHNDFKAPNITNMHTHGPHISGDPPGDFVFLNLGPEEKTTYKYEFDENHFPGTFWYHPHFHGSTALQVGQGAAGMMIIDDNELYPVPDAIKDMEEIQMVVQHMNLDTLRDASSTSLDNVTYWINKDDSPIENEPYEYTAKTTDLTNFMLVNMQFLPVVTMKVGKWYRWRMAMSSVKESVAFHPGSQHCEMKLLAKDAIYVNDAPRDISTVILSPGNRADVAVRCNSIGLQYMNVSAESADLFPAQPGNGNFDPDGTGNQGQFDPIYDTPAVEDLMGSFMSPKGQPVLLVINVTNYDDDLPEFGKDLRKPCYLVDLKDERVDAMFEDGGEAEDNKFTNAYTCARRDIMPDYKDQPASGRSPISRNVCGVGGPYGKGGDLTTEKTFEEAYNEGGLMPWKDDTYYINDFDTGTVQEIRYTGAQGHPYHQHVNSYQIQTIEPTGELKEFVKQYYKEGDWHDVLQFPHNQAVDVTFRFQADQFTGHMVQHCHLLFHEDQGMMAQYDITGKEGAWWKYAQVLDHQCVPPLGSKSHKSKSSKTM